MPTLLEEFTNITNAFNERGIDYAVSKEGLIFMKNISGRLQDLADIERLENEN